MKYTAVILFYCIYAVSAVQYYGFTPDIKLYNSIDRLASLINSEDKELVSVFKTNDFDSPESAKFLQSYFATNVTFHELFADKKPIDSLEKRAAVNVACNGNTKVTDRIGETATKHICYGLSSLVGGGGVAAIGAVVHSKTCATRPEGHQTFCYVLLAFSGGAAGAMSIYEVNEFCPQFLNIFDDGCKGAGGSGNAEDGKLKAVEEITQTDSSCSDYRSPCTEINQD